MLKWFKATEGLEDAGTNTLQGIIVEKATL